jgi:amidohydrolase
MQRANDFAQVINLSLTKWCATVCTGVLHCKKLLVSVYQAYSGSSNNNQLRLVYRNPMLCFLFVRKYFYPLHYKALGRRSPFFYLPSKRYIMRILFFLFLCSVVINSSAQVTPKLQASVDQMAKSIEPKLIEWRRHFHQFPELSNREIKTAAKIADHLKSLGIEVKTGIAHTGVVGILKGGKPGPVIALRADMDALPVTERNNLPFASKEKATFNGVETGVMHACGHDTHVAILMSVAEILAKHKSDLKGTVKFIFQPAEEGPPEGEEGGAALMVKEGVLDNPKVDVIFGMHIRSFQPLGTIEYKPKGMMAASDWFTVKVTGVQAHGATPWRGVDPVVVSSQIINGLQTIISRQTELTKEAAVITVGRINGGIRENIIPEQVEFSGTIRTLDPEMQKDVQKRIKQTAEKIAEASGAKAEVSFVNKTMVVYNNPDLTNMVAKSFAYAAGAKNVFVMNADTGAEDFSFFQEKVPGYFFFVGACPSNIDCSKAPSHHTPDFMIDEKGMLTGLKAMLQVTLDYMFTSSR